MNHQSKSFALSGATIRVALMAFALVALALIAQRHTASALPEVSMYSGDILSRSNIRPPTEPPFNNTTGKKPATPGNQPWQVSLQLAGAPPEAGLRPSDVHICGGVLIAPQYVLTAAHCTDGTLFLYDVMVGADNLNDGTGELIPIESVWIHADTQIPHPLGVLYMDVAMIKLARPATKGTPIPVMPPSADPALVAPGTMSRSTGWGLLAGLGNFAPEQLFEVQQPIISAAECAAGAENVAGAVTPDMICAGTLDQFNSSCNGDSGGPLTVKSADGQSEVLVGLVSWGSAGCGWTAGEYSVYHRTTASYGWAQSIMNGQIPADAIQIELEEVPWEEIFG